ncbi:uncharacterized protein LOC143729611 [Siphateles boraxobius]|uniref:uncharacterized protein LOC143729611 n=1 Tax=Siphateles boraxobius TaxID=180520 RepID=UPI00406291C1
METRRPEGSRCVAEGVRCLYVICSGGCAYTHPRGMLSALMEGAGAPGLRWWGERVTAYTHLEALQVSRAWLPESVPISKMELAHPEPPSAATLCPQPTQPTSRCMQHQPQGLE